MECDVPLSCPHTEEGGGAQRGGETAKQDREMATHLSQGCAGKVVADQLRKRLQRVTHSKHGVGGDSDGGRRTTGRWLHRNRIRFIGIGAKLLTEARQLYIDGCNGDVGRA